MSDHRRVRDSLYEYAMGELTGAERDMVERHVRDCRECARDLERVREAVGLLNRPAQRPSASRPDSYWERLAESIDQEIRRQDSREATPAVSRLTELLNTVWVNRKTFSLAAGSLAVAAVAIVLLVREPSPVVEAPPPTRNAVMAADTQDVKKMTQYLRQSKNLLVGLYNMKTRPESPGDLAAERDASRRLLQEAQVLRERMADPRTVELLDNIDGILVKVAGTTERATVPDIDLLRRGIREQNLLFKVRMAETALQATPAMNAAYRKNQQ